MCRNMSCILTCSAKAVNASTIAQIALNAVCRRKEKKKKKSCLSNLFKPKAAFFLKNIYSIAFGISNRV